MFLDMVWRMHKLILVEIGPFIGDIESVHVLKMEFGRVEFFLDMSKKNSTKKLDMSKKNFDVSKKIWTVELSHEHYHRHISSMHPENFV